MRRAETDLLLLRHDRMPPGSARLRLRRSVVGFLRAGVLTAAASCTAALLTVLPATAGATSPSLCIGHHRQSFVWYTSSCTGHDEPEVDAFR
jgi:hypothetical protein